jgi:hypothetical protein
MTLVLTDGPVAETLREVWKRVGNCIVLSAFGGKADIIPHRLECLLWVAISTGRCNTLFESVCRVGLICEIPSLDCYVIAA